MSEFSTTDHGPKRCPSCKLENPPSALYCDCGYEFVPGSKLAEPANEKAGINNKLSLGKHLILAWATGVVTSAAIALLYRSSPIVGFLSLPPWIPVVISMRSSLAITHAGMFLLMIFSGSIVYGGFVFILLWLLVWRNQWS